MMRPPTDYERPDAEGLCRIAQYLLQLEDALPVTEEEEQQLQRRLQTTPPTRDELRGCAIEMQRCNWCLRTTPSDYHVCMIRGTTHGIMAEDQQPTGTRAESNEQHADGTDQVHDESREPAMDSVQAELTLESSEGLRLRCRARRCPCVEATVPRNCASRSTPRGTGNTIT